MENKVVTVEGKIILKNTVSAKNMDRILNDMLCNACTIEETENSVVIEINGEGRFNEDDIFDYLLNEVEGPICEDTIEGYIEIHDENRTYRYRFVKELSEWCLENHLHFWEDFHYVANDEISTAPKVYLICEMANKDMTRKPFIKSIKGIWINKELANQAQEAARKKGKFNYCIIESRLGTDLRDLYNWENHGFCLD